MEIGKLPEGLLKSLVLSKLTHERKEVIMGAGVGEDCGVMDFGEEIGVFSTDPITGAGKGIGSLGIYISCNDVASNGVEPVGVLFTLLAPPDTTEEMIAEIMEDANRAAEKVNVQIIGGHTEVTDAVNQMVVSTTAIGKKPKNGMIFSKGAKVGDKIIMTKHCGLEGAGILASDRREFLKDGISSEILDEAEAYLGEISVVKEGVIAGDYGVNAMHDVTEGGILGALWEIGEASNLGVKVDIRDIPIKDGTKTIAKVLNLDPYRLISSGVMVMALEDHRVKGLIHQLREQGIEAKEIGEIIEGESLVIDHKGRKTPLNAPQSDELYKGLKVKML